MIPYDIKILPHIPVKLMKHTDRHLNHVTAGSDFYK
jgi:hypothetical protein